MGVFGADGAAHGAGTEVAGAAVGDIVALHFAVALDVSAFVIDETDTALVTVFQRRTDGALLNVGLTLLAPSAEMGAALGSPLEEVFALGGAEVAARGVAMAFAVGFGWLVVVAEAENFSLCGEGESSDESASEHCDEQFFHDRNSSKGLRGGDAATSKGDRETD